MIIRKRIRGRAVMPHLYDAPRFQEYHPSSDELVGRELQLDPREERSFVVHEDSEKQVNDHLRLGETHAETMW